MNLMQNTCKPNLVLAIVVRFLRFHNMASLGFAVVVLDSRGSNNRGLKFEGTLKNKLVSCSPSSSADYANHYVRLKLL